MKARRNNPLLWCREGALKLGYECDKEKVNILDDTTHARAEPYRRDVRIVQIVLETQASYWYIGQNKKEHDN